MKTFAFLPVAAVLALGLAACSKTEDPANTAAVDTNSVVSETDGNFAAITGDNESNFADIANESDGNTATNAL